MARGWESKAVAEQLEEAAEERAPWFTNHETSPAVRERRERLESLRLSRSRTLAQLERATSVAHREMLERALRALEAEMQELK